MKDTLADKFLIAMFFVACAVIGWNLGGYVNRPRQININYEFKCDCNCGCKDCKCGH